MKDLEATHSEKGIELIRDAGTKFLGTPVEQSPDKAKEASPINYVTAASPPVLILQGGKDDLVPVAQSRRLQAALGRAGVKNQFILVKNAGHDGPLFSTPKIESQVVDFLNGTLASSGDRTPKIQN
jgi:dipeptidyl aminopeptidase/acylaminoacyl peptidase